MSTPDIDTCIHEYSRHWHVHTWVLKSLIHVYMDLTTYDVFDIIHSNARACFCDHTCGYLTFSGTYKNQCTLLAYITLHQNSQSTFLHTRDQPPRKAILTSCKPKEDSGADPQAVTRSDCYQEIYRGIDTGECQRTCKMLSTTFLERFELPWMISVLT